MKIPRELLYWLTRNTRRKQELSLMYVIEILRKSNHVRTIIYAELQFTLDVSSSMIILMTWTRCLESSSIPQRIYCNGIWRIFRMLISSISSLIFWLRGSLAIQEKSIENVLMADEFSNASRWRLCQDNVHFRQIDMIGWRLEKTSILFNFKSSLI